VSDLDSSFWRKRLAPYARPDTRRSVIDVLTSAVPYLALTALMYAVLDVSHLLVLALAIPAAGFLLRTFIVFHDCTHGSFLANRRANNWVGIACGLLVYTPFHSWRHEHAVHHATSGDLDKRGMGDVETLTAAEYRAKPWYGRLGYRLFRNPVIMLGLGPIWALMLEPRLVPGWARPRFAAKIIATDLAIAAIVTALILAFGWQAFLLVQMPAALLAGAAGVFLFYVQHQFEDVYWERNDGWSFADSALRGASHLVLPKVLQFFTGNIGLHHVHHLSARIPNCNLQRAHDENPVFHDVPTLTLADGFRALRLKVYDEESRQLVTFAEAATS
jgi:acyl-lipid omega-6 desaturase (Delta-12 desaturase)